MSSLPDQIMKLKEIEKKKNDKISKFCERIFQFLYNRQ